MITREQIQRAIDEQRVKAAQSFNAARVSERELETYTYLPASVYNPEHRDRLYRLFKEDDYRAERDAWVLSLMKQNQEELRNDTA